MPEQDRPREKALAQGVASLTNAELLATLIGSGDFERHINRIRRKRRRAP